MKLSKIQHASRLGLQPALYTLLRETVSKESADKVNLISQHINHQYQLYFINAVLKSRILGEAAANRLKSVLNTGLSKVQAALAPNISSDVEPMLMIMAPKAGGIQAVRQLVDSAGKIRGPVISDQNWLNSLFAAFGINDQQIQINLKNQLEVDLGRTPQPNPGPKPKPQAKPQTGAQPQPQTGTQPQPQAKQPGLAGAVDFERSNATQAINDTQATLDTVAINRSNAAAELAKIQDKIRELMTKAAATRSQASPPPTESIINQIAKQLLNESEVRRNLNIIIPESIRQFCSAHGVPVFSISEANWEQFGNKLGNFLNGARDFVANPDYAYKQLGKQQVQYDNIKNAKYAIRIAIGQTREIFDTKLHQAGLNPEDILQSCHKWNYMRRQNESSPMLADLGRKLDVAYRLFNNDESPFIVPPPLPQQSQQQPQ